MKKLAFLSLILLIVASCNVYTDIYSTTSPDAKFNKYKTFAWLTDKADTDDIDTAFRKLKEDDEELTYEEVQLIRLQFLSDVAN